MVDETMTRTPRSLKHVTRLAATVLLLGGCHSRTIIDEHRVTPTFVGANESIVVLGRKTNSQYEPERDFINCVGQSLTGKVRVIPQQEFVDTMYPWFEAMTAPTNVAQLGALLANEVVAARIESYGVRYIVWLDGNTETVSKMGSMSCVVGPGGGGCFGFAQWDDEANYEASIWDFKDRTLSGKISAETKGTSYMPAVIVPVPLLARVKSNACHSLANQLTSFFTDDSQTALAQNPAGCTANVTTC
ncbi:MAG: hypothetical protein IT494_09420 [Gammaproteobacteria bacterium]|nr:hypothetical protein [Gammaproteobacteria bacterium]